MFLARQRQLHHRYHRAVRGDQAEQHHDPEVRLLTFLHECDIGPWHTCCWPAHVELICCSNNLTNLGQDMSGVIAIAAALKKSNITDLE